MTERIDPQDNITHADTISSFRSDYPRYDDSVYIVGTGKDLENYLPSIIGNAYIISSLFKSYTIIIFCNKKDSDLLYSWTVRDTNVHILLDEQEGCCRTRRIAAGRNRILQEVKTHMTRRKESAGAVVLAVMDLDDVNAHMFNRTILQQVMSLRKHWDSVSFTRPDYYDIWALRYRHFDVNPFDSSAPSTLVEIIRDDILSRLRYRQDMLFYPVYSAFNGFALYKMDLVGDCEYDGINRDESRNNQPEECEHVPFHKCMIRSNKARILIYKQELQTTNNWTSIPNISFIDSGRSLPYHSSLSFSFTT